MATPPKNPSDGTQPPAPRKPATPRKTTTRKAPATTAKAAVRKPAAPRKTAAKPAQKPSAKRDSGKTSGSGRKWGVAAVVGGVGAALTAGLLALRGSTPATSFFTPRDGNKAHQADGTDSSASFEAGIADEGTIPS